MQGYCVKCKTKREIKGASHNYEERQACDPGHVSDVQH